MTNITNKNNKNVLSVDKLVGLKRHSREINAIIKESLRGGLLELMKKMPYEKITITELCKKAGVSRTAFYGNFTTKDDILKLIVVELNNELVKITGSPFREYTDLTYYINLFTFVKEQSAIIKLIFDAGFQYKYLTLVNEIVLHNSQIKLEKKYQRLIWSGGLENALIYWIECGMQESVEEMAQFCCDNLVPWSL